MNSAKNGLRALLSGALLLHPIIACPHTTLATVDPHPDRVYPTPSNLGEVNSSGVNLLTGEVNLTFPLASIAGRSTAYELDAFYDSRSASLAFAFNALGGYGWKLLDYPKIVRDNGKDFLLDGRGVYEMDLKQDGGYSIGGPYYLWDARYVPSGGSSWSIKTESGVRYILENESEDGNYTVWHLSRIQDHNGSDPLRFAYSGGRLDSISNELGDKLVAAYDSDGRLVTITASRNGVDVKTTAIHYARRFGNPAIFLTGIERAARRPGGGWLYTEAETYFDYYGETRDTGVKNALSAILTPSGGLFRYGYYTGSLIETHHPVIRLTEEDGYAVRSSAVWYDFTRGQWTTDESGIFAQYNHVKFFPGGIRPSGSDDPTRPYGFDESYFFNGIAKDKLKNFPGDYGEIDATSKAVRGFAYKTETHRRDADLEPVSETTSYWEIGRARGSDGGPAYSRLRKEASAVDGVGKAISYVYGDAQLPRTVETLRSNPKIGGAGLQQDGVKVTVKYAFEEYPALGRAGLHVLSAPAQVTVEARSGGRGEWLVQKSDTVQWKEWDGARWFPWRSYILRKRVSYPELDGGFASVPDSGIWLKAHESLELNPYGAERASRDADGLVSSVVYDGRFDAYAVAGFVNADARAGRDAGYQGFEDYESNSSWDLVGGAVSPNEAHLGRRSYVSTGAGRISVSPEAAEWRGNTAYVVSAHVRASAGGTCTIGFKTAGGSWIVSKEVIPAPGNAEWRYAQAVAPSLSAGALPVVECSPARAGRAAIDDVRYGPAAAPFSATAYDLERGLATDELGSNGEVLSTVYDRTDRAIADVGPEGQVRRWTDFYESRSGSLLFNDEDSFDKNHPNMNITVQPLDAGTWEGFALPDSVNFPAGNLTNMRVEAGSLVTNGGAAGSAVFAKPVRYSDAAVAFAVFPKAMGENQEMGVSFPLNGADRELRLTLQKLNHRKSRIWLRAGKSAGTEQALDRTPDRLTLMLQFIGSGDAAVYANGRFLFKARIPTPAGALSLVSTNPGGRFENFFYLVNPLVAGEASDGLDHIKQLVAQEGDGMRQETENLYSTHVEELLATTKPTSLPGDGAAFDPRLIQKYDESKMEVEEGSIRAAWPAYPSKPFSFSKIPQTDPLLRDSRSGAGGIFAAGSKDTAYSYGKNGGRFFGFGAGTLNRSKSTSADKTVEQDYSNPDGDSFGRATFSTDGRSVLQEQYEYDESMNIVRKAYPNFFVQNSPGRQNYTAAFQYDFTGNRVSASRPDSGTGKDGYDRTGRLRVESDANGESATPRYCRYWKYESLGRVREQGQLTVAGNGGDGVCGAAPSDLDDPDWPSANTIWRKKFTYDLSPDGTAERTLGRLTSIRTPDTEESFQYDASGNATAETFTDGIRSATFTYSYDLAGDVTRVQNGSDYDVLYSYDRLGRLQGIGKAGAPEYYAGYSYENGKIVEKLGDSKIRRERVFDAADRPTEIAGDVFNEKLYYQDRLDGAPGSGYFDGRIASAWSGGVRYQYRYDDFGRLAQVRADQTIDPKLDLAYDADGNLLSLKQDDAASEFDYLSGTNRLSGGRSFRPVASVFIGADVALPIFAVDRNSTAYAAASYSGAILVRRVEGAAWVPVGGRIPLEFGDVKALAFGPAEVPYLAYVEDTRSPDTRKIIVRKFDGGEWKSVGLPVASGLNLQLRPTALQVDASGNPVVAYQDASSKEIHVKRFQDQRWTELVSVPPQTQLLSSVLYAAGLHIAVLESDVVRVYAYDADGWISLGEVSSGGEAIADAMLKVDNGGRLNIAYVYSLADRSVHFKLKRFDGNTWVAGPTGDAPSSPWPSPIIRLRLAFDDRDGPVVALGRDNGSKVYKLVQNGWETMFEKGGNKQDWPGIGFDPQGKPVIVYRQDNYAHVSRPDSLEYDANGDVTASSRLGISRIAYDAATRLPSEIRRTGAADLVRFRYDGRDRRYSKRTGAKTVEYFRGLGGSPLVEDETDGAGAPTRFRYVYGPTGLVAMSRNGTDYWALTDHLGSVRAVVDKDANSKALFYYSPLGELLSRNAPPNSIDIRYRYTGQEYDAETGLYNYGSRLYDPGLARFYAPDPLEQFASPYLYAGNDPISLVDSDGRYAIEPRPYLMGRQRGQGADSLKERLLALKELDTGARLINDITSHPLEGKSKILVVDSDDLCNGGAACLLGRHIYFSRSRFFRHQDEDTLLGAIAHELTHLRDRLRGLLPEDPKTKDEFNKVYQSEVRAFNNQHRVAKERLCRGEPFFMTSFFNSQMTEDGLRRYFEQYKEPDALKNPSKRIRELEEEGIIGITKDKARKIFIPGEEETKDMNYYPARCPARSLQPVRRRPRR